MAATFPKWKPEQTASADDGQASPADVPALVPIGTDARPEVSSIVDILRRQHAGDRRVLSTLNAIRGGSATPPDGLINFRGGVYQGQVEGRGFDGNRFALAAGEPAIRLEGYDAPAMQVDATRPIAMPPLRSQHFFQPHLPNVRMAGEGASPQVMQPDLPAFRGIQPWSAPLDRAAGTDGRIAATVGPYVASQPQPIATPASPIDHSNASFDLYNLAANHRNKFMATDLSHYPDLDSGGLKTFSQIQASMKSKDQAEYVGNLHNFVTNSLRGYGLGIGEANSESRRIYVRDHNALMAGLMKEAQSWQAAHGALPGNKELRAMRDRLLPSLPVGILPGQRVDQKGFRTFQVPDISNYPDIDLTPEQEAAIIQQMKLLPKKRHGWEWSTSRVANKFTPYETLKQSHESKVYGAGDVSLHNHTGGDGGTDSEDWDAGFFPGPGDHIPVAINKKPITYVTPDGKMLIVIGIKNGQFFARPFWWDGDPRKARKSIEDYQRWKPSGKDRP